MRHRILLNGNALGNHGVNHAPHRGGGQRMLRRLDVETTALLNLPHTDAINTGRGAGLLDAGQPIGTLGVGAIGRVPSRLLHDERLAERVSVARQHEQGVQGFLVIGVSRAHIDLNEAVHGRDVQTGLGAVSVRGVLDEARSGQRPIHAGAPHHSGQALVEGDEIFGAIGLLVGIVTPVHVRLAGQGDVNDMLAGAVGAPGGERTREQRRDVGLPVEVGPVRIASGPDRRIPDEGQVQDDAHARVHGGARFGVHLLVLALGVVHTVLEAGGDDVGQTHDGHARVPGFSDPFISVLRPLGGGDDELAALVEAVRTIRCGMVGTRVGRVLSNRSGRGFGCWRSGHRPDRNG